MYLSSCLKANGVVEVERYYNSLKPSVETLKATVANTDADLIGVTMYSYCYMSGQETISLIKDNSDLPLVVGGPHVSSTKKQIFEDTKSEFAIKHEDEKPLLELLNFICSGRQDYESIEGLL